MTKAEIIHWIAESTGKDKKTVANIVDAFLGEIKEMLASGDTVNIAGFGTFAVTEKAEKAGRNPRTGEKIIIPAHKAPHFSPATSFKNLVNGK